MTEHTEGTLSAFRDRKTSRLVMATHAISSACSCGLRLAASSRGEELHATRLSQRPGRRGDSERICLHGAQPSLCSKSCPPHVAEIQHSGKKQVILHSATRPAQSGKRELILSVSSLKPGTALSASRGPRPFGTRSQHHLTALHPVTRDRRHCALLRAACQAPPRSQSSPPNCVWRH